MTEWDSSAWLSWTRSYVWLISQNGSALAKAGSRRRFVNAQILKHPFADCQFVPQTWISPSCNKQRGEKPCSRMRWQKRKPQNREKVLSVSLFDMQKGVWGLRSHHPIRKSRWWGIMRGFTGLIITTCQFKHKNTGWMEKMKHPIRICSTAGSEQPLSARQVACCS